MRYLAICFLCLTGIELYAQCNDWENLLTFEDTYVQDTDRDRFGNLYVVGSFFNPDFKIGNTTIPYLGGNTIFLLKFDKDLSIIWGKSFGTGYNCSATHLEIDNDDNIVVAGHYFGGPLVIDCIQIENSGRFDVFVAKFFPDGTVQWGKHSTGTNDEQATGLAITKTNQVILVGNFVEGSGSFENVPTQTFGGLDSFIIKLGSEGGVEWTSGVGGSGGNLPDYIFSVDVDLNDNVLITGMFESEKLFIGSHSIDRKTISENYFVAKLSPSGQSLWAKSTSMNVDASGWSVKVGHDNNIYTLGRFYNGTIMVDGFSLTSIGNADVMLIKYSPDGSVLAAINFGGAEFDSGTKLDIDTFGNIVATGYYYSSPFNVGPFTATKAESSNNLFVTRFDTELVALCFSEVSGNAEAFVKDVDVDRAGNVWLAVENLLVFGQIVFDTKYTVNSDKSSLIVSLNDIDNFDAGSPLVNFDVNLGEDNFLCPGENTMLDAGEWCNAIITWQDGSHDRFLNVLQPGEYWVEVIVNGMVARDSILFSFSLPNTLDLGKDTTLCFGQSLLLDAGKYCGVTYEWQNGSTSSTLLVTQPGTYSVNVKDGANIIEDAINVSYYPLPDVNLGEDKKICDGELIAFNVTQSTPSEYLWSDGSTLPTFTIDDEGIFWVKVTTTCQTEYDTITITRPGPVVLDLGEDRTICSGAGIVLGGEVANAVSYVWQDGTTAPDLVVTSGGIFSVIVSNGCIEAADSVRVSSLNHEEMTVPNVITPNDDAANDIFVVPEVLKGSQLRIYNRWGEDVYYSDNYQNTWAGEGQSPGVYYYTIQGVCPVPIKGIIHLLKN